MLWRNRIVIIVAQKTIFYKLRWIWRYNKFIEGAEWADRTMIARFCEWIEEHIENAFVSIDGTMTDINGIELSEVVRKAMEE